MSWGEAKFVTDEVKKNLEPLEADLAHTKDRVEAIYGVVMPTALVKVQFDDVTITATDGVSVLESEPYGDSYRKITFPHYGTWTVNYTHGAVEEKTVIEATEGRQYTCGFPKRYCYVIHKTDSNPATRVTYALDAEGMTPAAMDFSSGVFRYGDWADLWFVKKNKPLMLKKDRTVDYYLNPNDYSLREDGQASDIANASYDGNAMAQFATVWQYQYEEGDYEYDILCQEQYDENYKAYAHTRADGSIAEYFYWSMFGGSTISSVLRSLSGQSVAQSQTTDTQLTQAKANGEGWYIHTWSQRRLIQSMLTLMCRSTDTQTAYGNGNCNSASSASGLIGTGRLNNKGQFYGVTSNTEQVKVFHIEQFWGNQWDRTAGVLNNASGLWVKMTPEGNGYQTTATTGYTQTGIVMSGTSGGYISSVVASELGRLPKVVSGSTTTYECDGAWFNNSQLDYLLCGASAYHAAAFGGAFTFSVDGAPSYASWTFGCGLSCEQPVAAA